MCAHGIPTRSVVLPYPPLPTTKHTPTATHTHTTTHTHTHHHHTHTGESDSNKANETDSFGLQGTWGVMGPFPVFGTGATNGGATTSVASVQYLGRRGLGAAAASADYDDMTPAEACASEDSYVVQLQVGVRARVCHVWRGGITWLTSARYRMLACRHPTPTPSTSNRNVFSAPNRPP